MKQLTVLSGKGGTGKTSITAAFAGLAENVVLADCDVDAADLHLILKPEIKETTIFHGLNIAYIDKKTCTGCRKCVDVCKFGAIDDEINIIQEACEGCGVCEYICPSNAIEMINRKSGFSYISDTRFGPMSHASLNTAEEASGKLVTVVRENAITLAETKKKELILIDGPPGIGCPVISSISGVDLVLIVTEPTLAAIHDLERVLGVSNHFNIPTVVCINKYNINEENTRHIEQYCQRNDVNIVGRIPYDTIVTDAMVAEKTVVEFSDGIVSKNICEMWNEVYRRLKL